MIPEIIGADVPSRFLQNIPKVHKLTLAKENEKFREKANRRLEGLGKGDTRVKEDDNHEEEMQ